MEGRGTEEMKTNDVSGRFGPGEVGFTVDVGRPGVGTTFEDVERISMAVAVIGVRFEPMNPVTRLMADLRTGRFKDHIRKERVLSCILEFKADEAGLLEIVHALETVAGEVDTVFSVGCISRCRPDGTAPAKEILERAGVFHEPNGKVNVGLGRPLAP